VKIRWFGQSAFLVSGNDGSLAIDPFVPPSPGQMGQIEFNYPSIDDTEAHVLLVTHEHMDHNGVEAIGGEPHLIRSTTGTWDSPLGQIVGIASEHDEVAGTQRGPNTIFTFTLDGLRLVHFGDFGQASLRPEQRAAIGEVDILFLPVGDGPTIGGEQAAAIVRELQPRLVVPMHYRTPAINFLDSPDAFLGAMHEARVERLDVSEVDVEPLLGDAGRPTIAVIAPPLS
jgi:L-ascorbate metabolism protein UlaG (beta-lactamase superfamily)